MGMKESGLHARRNAYNTINPFLRGNLPCPRAAAKPVPAKKTAVAAVL